MREIEMERDLDVFGTDDEWAARKNKETWKRFVREKGYYDEEEQEEDGGPKTIDKLAKSTDKAPKIEWQMEVSGERSASFYSKVQDFKRLGASDKLQAALTAVGAERPSFIQGMSFGHMKNGADVVIADQTGSGKTLAYLAPIVQKLRQVEQQEGPTPGGKVRALVLAPTAELCQQVVKVAKAIAREGLPFRTKIITGEHPWATQKRAADDGIELLVGTPGRIKNHLEADPPSFDLSLCGNVVLDEADLLFQDEDFEETWMVLRDLLPTKTSQAFVTATLPEWLVSRLKEDNPLLKVLKGKNLHRTAAGVTEKQIDCGAGSSQKNEDDGFELKMSALLKELASHPADRVLIFCNTIDSARRVENALRRKDRKGQVYIVNPFHGAIAADSRREILEKFVAEVDTSAYSPPRILVCTDRASRGIDFKEVRHVVLFDFPRDGVEYVRRVGRCTRGLGTPGHVTSLLLGRQIKYARELMKINRKGNPISLEVHGHERPDSKKHRW